MAVEADSGQTIWAHESPLVSMSLAADDQRVYFHDGERIQCLNRRNGDAIWASDPLPVKDKMRSSGGATLVIYDDVVLYSGQVSAERPRQANTTTMFALSVKDGKQLWQSPHHPCGHMGTPDDILVSGGLVWNGAVAKGNDSGTMTGRDLHTGEVKSEFTPDVETHWFHHRCYRAKATDKYLLFSRTGIEFIDPAKRALDLPPLGAWRVPLWHHAVQRAHLRPTTPVRLLHRSQALRLHGPGTALPHRTATAARSPTPNGSSTGPAYQANLDVTDRRP